MLHFFWSGYPLAENSYATYEISNHEIAKWAEFYLGQKTSFHQSSWAAGKVTENHNDILIGHLTWDGRSPDERQKLGELKRDWVKDNALKPEISAHPNTYILTPWVPEFPPEWIANMPFWQGQLQSVSKIFALCGDIWIKRTFEKADKSIQTEVRDKLVHCNMGVAAHNFAAVKTRFNKVGQRHILHMSNLGSYKGFDITCKSLAGLDTRLHLATGAINAKPGMIEIATQDQKFGVNYLGYANNADPDFNKWVVNQCDFYIHTASMDAQATTILECGARGLIPLITPESGFASPYAIYLTHDPAKNREIIRQALLLPEDELLNRSRLLRQQIKKEHGWETIFGRIWDTIQNDIEQRKQ
jgi:hypothetical protein